MWEGIHQLRRKFIGAAIALAIAISWGGNLLYYNSVQLREPLFLQHYIAVRGLGGEALNLSYLVNAAEADLIAGIQIEELPTVRFTSYEQSRYSHQVLMRAHAEWQRDAPGSPDESQLPLTIREATIHYRDGRPPQRVPIGEIRLTGYSGTGLVDFASAGGSSDGTGSYTVRLTERATLEKVDYMFNDRLEDGFQLALNGVPIDRLPFPLPLEAGDLLRFTYAWVPGEDERVALEQYVTMVLLDFRLADGEAVTETLPVNRNVYLSEAQVKKLVRAANRGEGDRA